MPLTTHWSPLRLTRVITSPIFTAPTSVQAQPTRSPATKRSNHKAWDAWAWALRRSSTKAKWPRSAWGTLESASASSISNWNSCGSEAPAPPKATGMRTAPKPASFSQRMGSWGRVRSRSRATAPSAMRAKIGRKRWASAS